ncbi:MAG: hypothetical protein GXP26_01605 [Planctomycetes bacterium]|nr:hypothetical protein [Planctomycetota bacterium]
MGFSTTSWSRIDSQDLGYGFSKPIAKHARAISPVPDNDGLDDEGKHQKAQWHIPTP